jgi:hypothetical protein
MGDLSELRSERGEKMSCKYAIRTDEYHGWECSVTEGACMFLRPDSKECAKKYGEGPEVFCDEKEETAWD